MVAGFPTRAEALAKQHAFELAGVSAGPKVVGKVLGRISSENGLTAELRGSIELEVSRAGVALEKADPKKIWTASWELWEGLIWRLYPWKSDLAFIEQPKAGLEVAVGDQLVLTAKAAGPDSIAYEWYKDGKLVSFGERRFFITNAQLKDSGSYQVVARSGSQVIFSETATVTVTPT